MEKQAQEPVSAETKPDGVNGDRVAELEKLLMARDGELAGTKARLVELEQTVMLSEKKVSELTGSMGKAVSSYRMLVVQSHPDVPEELIAGDSIEVIDASLKSARELVGKIRAGIEADTASARVPAGAPQRALIDISALSPREKINLGIERFKN